MEVLAKLGYLEAKPKVGYIIKSRQNTYYKDKKVSDVMSVATIISEKSSLHDAVVSIFLEDVGSLFVNGEKGVPYINVETDFSQSDIGQLATRLTAFIEML